MIDEDDGYDPDDPDWDGDVPWPDEEDCDPNGSAADDCGRSFAARERAEKLRARARAELEDVDIDGRPLPESVAMDTITPEEVTWLWPGWLTAGFVLLEGGVGCGKSVFAADTCARVSRGLAFPGERGRVDPRCCLWMTAEEKLGRHVRGRLVAAGADLSLVRALPALAGLDLTSGPGLAWLRRELEQYRYKLIVLDSLKSFLGDCEDNNDSSVRRALVPLVELANEFDCVILGLRHWRKSAGLALERGGGSVAFTAMAEVVIAVGAKDEQRYIAQAKNRSAELATHAWPFDIEPGEEGSYRVRWHSAPEVVSANQLSMADVATKAKLSGGKERLIDQARAAIEKLLADGPCAPSEVLEKVMEITGCSKNTARSAARVMGLPDGRRVDKWST
jgi:hypothetical protein